MTGRKDIRITSIKRKGAPYADIRKWSVEEARKVHAYHKSFPGYEPTPLAELKTLAESLGVSGIYVKDESYRFDLNAFKVLGGSYAAGNYIARLLGKEISDVDYSVITSDEAGEKLKGTTFVTATDGNHGRGIAWTAARLGLDCVVYMPRGTAQERLENICRLGADASITDMVYDDCVRKAASDAAENGWVLMQDTAWDGYEEIPSWIMQGYMTMAYEAVHQISSLPSGKDGLPTHILLQAGVGSMAAALTAFFRNYYKEAGVQQPVIIIVEPDSADCIYRTAAADDGKLHISPDMHTIMAGLACGEPCTTAWAILHAYADFCAAIPDSAAASGMRILSAPLGDDPRVISGESGASGFGCIAALLADNDNTYAGELKRLNIDAGSRILCISTEGATDLQNYRRIVWNGAYPSVGIVNS